MLTRDRLPRHGLVALSMLASLATASGATAEPPSGGDVVVLPRSGDANDASTDVGRALVTALRATRDFATVDASPTSLERLALAAGCDEHATGCGHRIAQSISATIVVWDVAAGDRGRRLTLVAYEPRGRRAAVRGPAENRAAVVRSVQRLTHRLFGPAAPAPADARSRRWRRADAPSERSPSALSLAAVGGGTVALAGGISLAVSAGGTPEEGGDARATRRRRGGYALLSLGSALLAVGGTLVVLELGDAPDGAGVGVSAGDRRAVAWLRLPVGR